MNYKIYKSKLINEKRVFLHSLTVLNILSTNVGKSIIYTNKLSVVWNLNTFLLTVCLKINLI